MFFLGGFLVTCRCMTGFLVEKNHPLPSLLRPAVHVSLKPLESASRDIRLYLGMWKYGKIMKIMAVNPKICWIFCVEFWWILPFCSDFWMFVAFLLGFEMTVWLFLNHSAVSQTILVAPRWFEVCFGWSKRPFWLLASQISGAESQWIFWKPHI